MQQPTNNDFGGSDVSFPWPPQWARGVGTCEFAQARLRNSGPASNAWPPQRVHGDSRGKALEQDPSEIVRA